MVLELFFVNFMFSKGQLISKKIVRPRILPKNERMKSFLLVCDVFSFVFGENPRPEKNVSKLSDLYASIKIEYLHKELIISLKRDA